VLFWLQSPRRETALHTRLAASTATAMIPPVPLATATPALAAQTGQPERSDCSPARPRLRLRLRLRLAQLTTA
jgi:hypothetical protein